MNFHSYNLAAEHSFAAQYAIFSQMKLPTLWQNCGCKCYCSFLLPSLQILARQESHKRFARCVWVQMFHCCSRLSSSFCTMPFKCPSMPFQIAFLYDIILRGMPFQMPFQIDVKLFERAFGRACPSTFYHTKGQFERALKGIWWYDIRRAFTI